MKRRVFIVGAKRTAIGVFGGSLKSISAPKLGSIAIKAAIDQAGVEPSDINEVIVGNVLMAGQGMGPARQSSIYAGIPVEVPAYTVHMVCGSGMKSIIIGAKDIAYGEADLVVAGGMENMSQAPYLVDYKARFGAKFGDMKMTDHMVFDGLTDIFNQVHMGITAEEIASRFEISREEQDEYALESQNRARAAIAAGKFKDEIVPVEVVEKKQTRIFDTDEGPRETSIEKLARLRPAFKKDGTVTAGNSSTINDGASAVILASEDYVKAHGLKPLAEVIAWGQGGVDPMVMGLGPVPATDNALKYAGLKFTDIDLIEANEAFAVQTLGVIRKWNEMYGVSKDYVIERANVNGGAIALGHPIGCSGNRIVVTLLYEMMKRGVELGLATLCIGGGMGTAIIIKRI
ncbi:acetyl-CoA C-acetyltransferase [Kosmotoga olearia]|uniref:Acetyl-CoA acetyltransferase n=1 Tax=Kosmotoga olearia (strain ATCC BAA-1733 / DSM 21960 / TBF 19.5.1) TaxID=521045 RepID=C5CEY7_KOSOT|nr:acetyl-CoA C-acetyltransferase [Kosmotoga olearia]ACR79316.1 acetyl-CoA acetyltransferase [Kosmotoga olearia TBF 19.5.1]